MSTIRLALRATLATAAVVLASALMPRAAAAQADSVITACYVPTSGSVYRIKAANAPSACTKTSHVEFSWRNEPSLAGYSVHEYLFAASAGATHFIPRGCPVGQVVVSGGAIANDILRYKDLVVNASLPYRSGLNTAWHLVVTNTSATKLSVRVTHVCAKAPPL